MFQQGGDGEGCGGPEPVDTEEEIKVEVLLPDAPPVGARTVVPPTTKVENPVTNESPNKHILRSEAELMRLNVA